MGLAREGEGSELVWRARRERQSCAWRRRLTRAYLVGGVANVWCCGAVRVVRKAPPVRQVASFRATWRTLRTGLGALSGQRGLQQVRAGRVVA